MKFTNIIMLLISVLVFTGCGDIETPTETQANFTRKIEDWQEREAPLQEHLPVKMGDSLSESYARTKLYGILKAHDVKWVEDDGPDYWRTSEEFVNNGNRGDCEDISIYLYYWIRMNKSFPDNDITMRVVDNYWGGKDKFHIIISVYTLGDTIIIDNGTMRPEQEQHTKITTEFNLFAIW